MAWTNILSIPGLTYSTVQVVGGGSSFYDTGDVVVIGDEFAMPSESSPTYGVVVTDFGAAAALLPIAVRITGRFTDPNFSGSPYGYYAGAADHATQSYTTDCMVSDASSPYGPLISTGCEFALNYAYALFGDGEGSGFNRHDRARLKVELDFDPPYVNFWRDVVGARETES